MAEWLEHPTCIETVRVLKKSHLGPAEADLRKALDDTTDPKVAKAYAAVKGWRNFIEYLERTPRTDEDSDDA
jgi:hypothetical protein